MRPLLMAAPAVLWAATAGAAAPLTLLTLAPAADGGIDVRDGPAVAAHVPLKTAALRRRQPRLREIVVDGHRAAELRVPVRGPPAEETWSARLAASAERSD